MARKTAARKVKGKAATEFLDLRPLLPSDGRGGYAVYATPPAPSGPSTSENIVGGVLGAIIADAVNKGKARASLGVGGGVA